MTHSDAFALKNSGLNEFLFAEVGNELNGSPLTILSVLARLGQDPWVEAARWAKLPKAAIIDCLAYSISQMPLSPQALGDARATATRLILLLPSQIQLPLKGQSATTIASKARSNWVVVALVATLVFGVAYSLLRSTPPTDASIPLAQPLSDHPQPPTN
jgi:hypothetical protein